MLTQPEDGGTLVSHGEVESALVAPRRVDVWCPPGYGADTTARFPVIYMHDGQMLFDRTLAFNGEVWAVDRAIARLMREAQLPGALVVGVWNTARRYEEYMPARPLALPAVRERFARMIGGQRVEPLADQYLSFLVDELKPLIDATYRTLPDQAHTFIMGSSMGGLISLYALSERPAVFGGAGCLSTHWPAGGNELVDALAAALPPPGRHRLYFDYGTAGLDAAYEPFQLRMDAQLRAAGYVEGRDFHSERFAGADHNEIAWRARVQLPLRFLLGRP